MPLSLIPWTAAGVVGLLAVSKIILHLKRNKNFRKDAEELEQYMDTWDEEKLAVERRQAIWTLLNKYGRNRVSMHRLRGIQALLHKFNRYGRNRIFIRKLEEWQLDKAIFYELEDSYNTLREVANQIDNTFDDELKAELEKNLNEINTSVQELIELG